MITPEQFLIQKGLIKSEDLDTKWNLQITRDCYVGTTKRIVEALREYAAMAVQEHIDNRDFKE